MEEIIYTAFAIDNDPSDQPTPKMVWGNRIKNIVLEGGDEVFMINNPKNNFTVKDFIDDKIILMNPRQAKTVEVTKNSPLFKIISEIPKEQQEFFEHNQDIEGILDSNGVFQPNKKYLINYVDLFHKYFDLIRKTLYDDRIQNEITRLYERIFEEMGVAAFNQYIRSNFVENVEEGIEDMFQSTYEYGMEGYDGNPFVVSMMYHANRLDRQELFEQGVRAIVFNEGIKIDFSKL